MTARLRSLADEWKPVSDLPADRLASRIRSDRIDILIETTGMTGGLSLAALAMGCAPVQVTYCGYPNTTGLKSIDWRIVDSVTDPAGTDQWAAERLMRLDPCFLCYAPPEELGVAVRPRREGPIRFGSFNAAVKFNDALIALWSRVLAACPGSELVLKAIALADSAMREDVLRRLAACGVDKSKVRILEPPSAVADHLRMYEQVDIALDAFPYGGTTTTFEALWMGVPVVTLEGTMHPGRVGTSLLTALGMPELIARSADDYVGIAAGLAADSGRVAELRFTLRKRLIQSPLCDGPAFGARMTAALRSMWRDWCQRQVPA
jgi:predicted O-linked N-acetylglucosamine transferase (SPINDLY family)